MSKIQDRAMLVSLSIGMFSSRKTDKKVTREVITSHQADDKAGKFVKQILPEEALDQVKKIESEAREFHYKHTCPWTDEGARILPSVKYMEYVDFMRGKSALFEAQAAAFVDKFDDYIEQQRAKLNSMFNKEDYPSKEKVRKKFKFKTDFLPFPDSSDFRVDISDEEMAALRIQTEQRIREAGASARQDLWQRLAEPLKTMARSLSKTDGRIYDTVVSNIKDIVELVPALNITGDPELERICQQVRHDLAGVDVDALRRHPSTRLETAAKANAILATMSGYLSGDDTPPAPALELPSEPVNVPEPVTNSIVNVVAAPPALVVPIPVAPVIPSTPTARPSWRRRLTAVPSLLS